MISARAAATRMRCVLATVAFAAILSGCAKPYIPPVFEPADGTAQFPGLMQHLEKDGSLHLVWIHGMCPHSESGWARPRVELLAHLLGAPRDSILREPLDLAGIAVRYSFMAGARPVTADMIVWSSLIASLREDLCFDSTRNLDEDVATACGDKATYDYPRARLNDMLKSHIMNVCLADAVIYAGTYGAEVRRRVTGSLLAALGEKAPAHRGGVVFASESLGSKLLYDVLIGLMQRSDAGAAKVQARAADARQFFMFANQIPLLDLASRPPPEARDKPVPGAAAAETSLQELVRRIVDENRKQRIELRRFDIEPIEQLHVVAFSDPNDILSYRLPSDYFKNAPRVRVSNVLTSNAEVMLGLFENPAGAHTDYRKNADVLVLFVCGRTAEREACREQVRERANSLQD